MSAQLIHFVNSILLLNHLNRVVIIAVGVSSCAYILDSSDASPSGGVGVSDTFDRASRKAEEFVAQDARATAGNGSVASANAASLLSGALSLAVCCIQSLKFLDLVHFLYLILCLCCLTRRMFRYTEDFPVWDSASATPGEYTCCHVLSNVWF